MPSTGMTRKTLCLENVNPNVRVIQFDTRGPLITRAAEIENELAKGEKKPFSEVIRANVADCQAMGQQPLTFLRQVLTLCAYPALLKDDMFPSDAKERVEAILDDCGGRSVGAYTYSVGVDIIRKHVADYIERRDGYPSCQEDIILSTGASDAIRSILNILNYPVNGKRTGVLIPIPQYPLYGATLAELGMKEINYYLVEENNWAVDVSKVKEVLNSNRSICDIKAIVVINPGNPTGTILTKDNIREIIKFATEEKLVILADECQHSSSGPAVSQEL